MTTGTRAIAALFLLLVLLLSVRCYPNPQPPALTPVPTLPPGASPTLVPQIQTPLGATPSPFVPEAQTLPPGTAAPVPVATGQASAAIGAPLYQQNCRCHGNQGQGVDAPALRNSQFIQTAGDQAVDATIADGRPNTRMPPWLLGKDGPLTGVQIGSITGYLHTLQGVTPLPTATPMPSETPTPPGQPSPPPARPSMPGGPGAAVNLSGDAGRGGVQFGLFCAVCHSPTGVEGLPNPGSDDGQVPALNPIDPSIANPVPAIFATNLDLFIQHGSVPGGPGPLFVMPSFGDSNMLTQQQIADLIAYIMALNVMGSQPGPTQGS